MAVETSKSLPQSDRLTAGERLADVATGWLGSWPFIAVQGLLLLLWIVLNTIAWSQHWDPYPFILLNLALSFEAAFAVPIILMSQNRQSAKDREKAEADYVVDRQAESDIAAVHARLDDLLDLQWGALLDLQQQQLEILSRIEGVTRDVHRVTILHDLPPDTRRTNSRRIFQAARTEASKEGSGRGQREQNAG